MESAEFQRKVIYALVVLFLMVGVAVIGITNVMLEKSDEDYTVPHDYDVSGHISDADVTGDGRSEFINESKDEYIFRFTTTVEGQSIPSFNVICGADRLPLESLYLIGEVELFGDVECIWWSYSFDGHVFSFAIDSEMVVHEYRIQGDGVLIVGILR